MIAAMTAGAISAETPQDVISLSDDELIRLRHDVEKEVRRRGLKLTVGDIGERLVVAHFNNTAGLPNLQIAPLAQRISTHCRGMETDTR